MPGRYPFGFTPTHRLNMFPATSLTDRRQAADVPRSTTGSARPGRFHRTATEPACPRSKGASHRSRSSGAIPAQRMRGIHRRAQRTDQRQRTNRVKRVDAKRPTSMPRHRPPLRFARPSRTKEVRIPTTATARPERGSSASRTRQQCVRAAAAVRSGRGSSAFPNADRSAARTDPDRAPVLTERRRMRNRHRRQRSDPIEVTGRCGSGSVTRRPRIRRAGSGRGSPMNWTVCGGAAGASPGDPTRPTARLACGERGCHRPIESSPTRNWLSAPSAKPPPPTSIPLRSTPRTSAPDAGLNSHGSTRRSRMFVRMEGSRTSGHRSNSAHRLQADDSAGRGSRPRAEPAEPANRSVSRETRPRAFARAGDPYCSTDGRSRPPASHRAITGSGARTTARLQQLGDHRPQGSRSGPVRAAGGTVTDPSVPAGQFSVSVCRSSRAARR